MHSSSLQKCFIIVLFRIVPRRTHTFLCCLAKSEAVAMLTVDRVKNSSWKPLKMFTCSYSTEWLPKRSLSALPASAMCTMTPHKVKLAMAVWPPCLQALITFWGFFVSHRGDTGSEAEAVTGRVYKNWLPAQGLFGFLHCFSWRILQEDSFRALTAIWGYIIASIWISDYLKFLQNHQSPIPGLREGRGWEDLKFLSLEADSLLLRKARCPRLDIFCYPFHWLHTQANALGSLLAKHRDTRLRGETSSGNGFILQAQMNQSSFQRGQQRAGKDMPLKSAQIDSVYKQEENAHILVCLGM